MHNDRTRISHHILLADKAWLASAACDVRVAARYQHVCNCMDPLDSNALLWISTQRADFAPGVLVLSCAQLPPLLEPGARVTLAAHEKTGTIELYANDRIIAVGDAHVLRSVKPLSPLAKSPAFPTAQQLSQHALHARELLASLGKRTSAYHPDYRPTSAIEALIQRRLHEGGHVFCAALNDTPHATPHGASHATQAAQKPLASARSLIGLGSGLTPAGDDFIVGALAIAWLALPHVQDALDATAWSAALQQTTTVSRHYLSAARDGIFAERVSNAATSLILNPANATAALEELARFGASSGTDSLAGMTYMLAELSQNA